MILLDTDTLTLFMKGHSVVTTRVIQEEQVAVTIVTRIEVLQGRFASLLKAADGAQLLLAQQWLQENERHLRKLPVVAFDAMACSVFDRLRQNRKLKKIGRADLLIASIALAYQALLVTRNVKHFRLVPGLKVENWAT
jgi:tRNA(fMet)-specific endonuclease VapC